MQGDNSSLSGVAAPQHSHWIPLSDLMTGLMMIFMLIAITFMAKVEADSKHIREIAVIYERMKSELYADLEKEFKDDLPRWGAELHRDMTVRFREPDVLFGTGKDDLKVRFQRILDDFFPRYVRILASDKYRDVIAEVRIEGHTSSFWRLGTPEEEAYFKNMKLSQDRTRTTLAYVMSIPGVRKYSAWLREHITANGLSSSKPIIGPNGREDFARSQRVEFRVRTDAESRIARIIETVDETARLQ